MKLLLRLYPRWWRSRYGAEALDILQSRPVTPTLLWDVIVGALDAWLNQEMPPSGDRGRDERMVEGGFLPSGDRVRISGSSAVGAAATISTALRRNAAVIAAALLLAIVPAVVAAALTSNAGLYSWSDFAGSAGLSQGSTDVHSAYGPIGPTSAHAVSGGIIAAAGLAAVASALGLMLALMVVSLASFVLFGLPAVLALISAAMAWGIQVGFGGSAPLQGWLDAALGVALLALAINTGAALPMYWSRIHGSGRGLERRREAWASYWALYRGLVVPTCAVFGITVFLLIALIATS